MQNANIRKKQLLCLLLCRISLMAASLCSHFRRGVSLSIPIYCCSPPIRRGEASLPSSSAVTISKLALDTAQARQPAYTSKS